MKHRIVMIIIAVIFIIGVIGSVLILTAPQSSVVRIVSHGEIVRTIDLSSAADTRFDVESEDHYNTVEISDHRIRVADADCPDRTCVNMGWLSSSAMPIVCLPHELVIEYALDSGDVDAVTR